MVLAWKLRARADLPIIILTARDGMDDWLARLDVGTDDYLTKFMDPAEFILRVRNLLRSSRNPCSAYAQKKPKSKETAIQFDGWIVILEHTSPPHRTRRRTERPYDRCLHQPYSQENRNRLATSNLHQNRDRCRIQDFKRKTYWKRDKMRQRRQRAARDRR